MAELGRLKVAAGVPFAWFTADETYGQVKRLQAWLEERDIFYVMAIRCSDTLTTPEGGTGWKRGRGHWLLARRSLADPAEIASYFTGSVTPDMLDAIFDRAKLGCSQVSIPPAG